MLSLSYSACYDPYNCIFRMLAILKRSANQSMNFEALRIADFFVCFPRRLSEIRPPNSVQGMRKRTNSVLREVSIKEFELLPTSSVLFERMEVFHETAISALKAAKIIDVSGQNELRQISLKLKSVPEKLDLKIAEFIGHHAELIDLVSRDFSNIPISGTDGLKSRTGLGEFKYDTV